LLIRFLAAPSKTSMLYLKSRPLPQLNYATWRGFT
jgi:hypothetical protein